MACTDRLCTRLERSVLAMSTWRHVGMTYLKYADLCATHVVNCLKEPKKTQALSKTAMHIRITPWEAGKRQKAGALTLCSLASLCVSGIPPRGAGEEAGGNQRL
jgi:F-type H+-transporting ATPase subunit epsilon